MDRLMIEEIPFYPSEGRRCPQALLKSALKVRFPERDFSFEELDEITGHYGQQLTLPCQIAYAFLTLNIPFSYYIKPCFANLALSKFVEEVMKRYKINSNKILNHLNIDFINKTLSHLKTTKNLLVYEEKPSLRELEKLIDTEKIPIYLLNWDKVNGKQTLFKGHYILLTNYTKEKFFFYDSGPKNPKPNKSFSKNIFDCARDLCFFDWGLVVV